MIEISYANLCRISLCSDAGPSLRTAPPLPAQTSYTGKFQRLSAALLLSCQAPPGKKESEDFLRRPIPLHPRETEGENRIAPSVAFKNVSFRYPGAEEPVWSQGSERDLCKRHSRQCPTVLPWPEGQIRRTPEKAVPGTPARKVPCCG